MDDKFLKEVYILLNNSLPGILKRYTKYDESTIQLLGAAAVSHVNFMEAIHVEIALTGNSVTA